MHYFAMWGVLISIQNLDLTTLIVINEFNWFFIATLKVMLTYIHWQPIYPIRLVLIEHIVVIMISDRNGWITSPANFPVQPLKSALQVTFWICAWIAHRDIILLTWRGLISEQYLSFILSGEHFFKIMTQKLISCCAWEKFVMM